ncbi:hypothetical protein GF324_06755 [bacterium]|nr:hypothetical protein [bacterium]
MSNIGMDFACDFPNESGTGTTGRAKDCKGRFMSGSREGVSEQTMLRVVVPCFGEEVAPSFSATRRFRVWELERGIVTDYREVAMYVSPGLQRVKLMRKLGVDVLLCSGIENQLRMMLEADGIKVVAGIKGLANDALFGYLAGRIEYQPLESTSLDLQALKPHTADLVEWTRDLFIRHQWDVSPIRRTDLFPMDLIAEKECPECGKRVRAGVCCGAHCVKVREEIAELRRVTAYGYNARVYVNNAIDVIVDACREYEVELLDPTAFHRSGNGHNFVLPPLRGIILEHETIFHKKKEG